MKSRKLGVACLAGAVVLATAGIAGVKAQQKAPAKKPASAALPVKSGARNIQIIDVTEPSTIWPRTHVIYDFDHNTVTLLTINTLNQRDNRPIITVHEIKSLTKVEPPQ